jgi:hypothetical protein
MADDGFLSRWSKRKVDAREGKAIGQEPARVEPESPIAQAPAAVASPVPEAPPPPTLEDVQSLTIHSDFKRFVAPDVPADVKNAAVKKLFSDPRYNVRDMMDVYADDYSQPDPLPDSMLKQLASAQFLKLFEESPDDGEKKTVAQSPEHADPDLRLQQDDAPAGESAGGGVERGAAAPHDAVPPPGERVPEGDQG